VTAGLAGASVALALWLLGGWPAARRRPERPHPGAAPAAPWSTDAVRASVGSVLERAWPGRWFARRDAQLPDALDRLASSIRAGRAIGPALLDLAPTAPDPLRGDLRQVAAALAHGAPVARALETWAGQPGASADVRLVAAALTLGAEAGGEVARAVDRIAATLRERAELRGEVRALATQARASAGVLTIAPVAFTAVVATVEPGAVGFLLATPIGWACLALGLGLEVAGAVWMSRITRSAG